MLSLGTTELAILSAVLLLLFGGKRFPKFARGIGNAVREFDRSAGD